MIEKHPDESVKAFHAFLCYQNLGPQRTIALAYAVYRKCTTNPSKPSAAFIAWKAEFNWAERVEVWDRLEQAAARERQRSIDDHDYQAELEQFKRLQLNAGKQGTAIALNLKTKLLKWVETHPTTTNWAEALIVARLISTIEMSSAEQWAKALHIDRLLEQMLDNSEIDC